MPNIKDRIKELRKKYNYTQETLANALGLNAKSSIANYESGANSPSDDIKKKMCELFNCSMDYLMGITSHYNPKEDLEKELYSFDMSEEELNETIKFFDGDNIDTQLMILIFDKTKSREKDILTTITNYVVDYFPKQKDIEENEVEVKQEFRENLKKAQSLLKELDKSKIIHNYQNNINTNKQFYMCPVYGRISAGIPNWAEECIEGRIPIDYELMNILNPEECFFLRVNGESMNKEIANGAYALIRKQETVENGEIAVVLVNGNEATLKKFSKQGDVVVLEPMSNDPSFTTQIYNKDTSIKVIGKYIGKMEMK